jgi:hypothetical protein
MKKTSSNISAGRSAPKFTGLDPLGFAANGGLSCALSKAMPKTLPG